MKHVQLDHAGHTATAVTRPICYLAHDIDMPVNIGSFFRIADALGVEKIFLTGSSPTPPNPKITRTSRSTEKHVAFEKAPDPLNVIERLKVAGYKIISLEITSASIPLSALPLAGAEKICLILGAERHGVCQPLLDASDACIHIPMLGHNSSMNVANACAIATYELASMLPA